MKKYTTILSCLLMSLATMGQNNQLKGHVFDAYNHNPLEGAIVLIDGTGGGATDDKGEFTVACKGSMELTINYVSYETFKQVISNCDQVIQIGLIPTNYNLNQVEINASRIEKKPALNEAQSISVLTPSDLNRGSGINLQDALNTVPGVDMQTRTESGGQRIFIRGYYPNVGMNADFNGLGYQLFLNNIPVTDATGSTIMDDIDFSTLGKVEVIKGPSPLYGNSIAGTVNLFTERPQPNSTSINEQAIGGSYGLFRNNISVQTAGNNADMIVNYGHQSYNGFRVNDGSRKDYMSFIGDFYASEKQTISAYFSYSHSIDQLAGEIDSGAYNARIPQSNPFYVNNNSHVAIESFRAGITDECHISSHFGNQTTFFTTGHTLDQPFAHGFSEASALNFGGRTGFTYHGNAGSVAIDGVLGEMFQKGNIASQGSFVLPFIAEPPFTATTPSIPNDNQEYALNYNTFTKWNFGFPKGWNVMVGANFNSNEFGVRNMLYKGTLYNGSTPAIKAFTPVVSPSASLLKMFNNNVSAYVSVSTGTTPPLPTQITSSDGTINYNLKPESATQFEIGSKGNLGNKKFSYQLALYDLDIKDRLITESVNSVSSTVNAGEQRNMGVELYLSYSFLNSNNAGTFSLLRAFVSYTYTDAKYIDFKSYVAAKSDGNDSLVADYSNNKVAGVAPNMFSFGIDAGLKAGFYVNATLQYMDKVPITFDNGSYINSYTLLGAKIGYKHSFKHFGIDVFAGANNLTNSTYYNFIFVGPNIHSLAQVPGGGDGYILPAPYNATFYAGTSLSYKFK